MTAKQALLERVHAMDESEAERALDLIRGDETTVHVVAALLREAFAGVPHADLALLPGPDRVDEAIYARPTSS